MIISLCAYRKKKQESTALIQQLPSSIYVHQYKRALLEKLAQFG